MKRFQNYPIAVVFSEAFQDHAEMRKDHAFADEDPMMIEWWMRTGMDRLDIMEDAPSPLSRAWETTVMQNLQRVAVSKIGRLVLNQLKQEYTYWIIPLRASAQLQCECSAFAISANLSAKQGGGFRIFYSPSRIDSDRVDDVLLHEIVHVYRGTFHRNIKAMVDESIPTGEEFIAYQIQNMYRSELGKRVKYVYSRNPHSSLPVYGSHQDVYRFITDSPTLIQAFEYFLNIDEPLCRTLAKMDVAYNPWRDFPTLKRIANDKAIGGGLGVPLAKLVRWNPQPLSNPNDPNRRY